MTIKWNGAPLEIADGTTLAQLLARQNTATQGLLIELDGQLLDGHADYAALILHDGADLQFFRLVAGG